MRICRTTLWIKKSALFLKTLSLTTFGTFGAERGRGDRESAADCAFLRRPGRTILPRHAVHMSGDGRRRRRGHALSQRRGLELGEPFRGGPLQQGIKSECN